MMKLKLSCIIGSGSTQIQNFVTTVYIKSYIENIMLQPNCGFSNLNPIIPRVPLGDSKVHFDRNYHSIRTVKIHKILTTSSHITLEEDPMIAFSIFSSWQFLITEVEIPLKWLGNFGVKG